MGLTLQKKYSMLRTVISSLILLISCSTMFSQISITGNDMPVAGDTIRKSLTLVLDGINYEQAGPDQTWDFRNLTVASQSVDTFISVSETPAVYQLFFNNQFIYPDHKATVALKLSQFSSIPGFEVSDSYQFLKYDGNEFREVGYGVSLAGTPLPLQYQQIDTIYRFPLTYGQIDSSNSNFQVSIPDLGFLQIKKFRKNTADGWGTLITPYGEFQTLRVKTEIQEYDSIYIDSLNMGMPLNRNITEYKWLANNYHQPLLQVNVEDLLITAAYIDSVRYSFLRLTENQRQKFDFQVYPNPSNDYLSISYELLRDADVKISVFSVYGNEMKRFANTRQEKGLYNRVLYLKESGFRPGIYLIRLTIDDIPYVKRILLN